MAEQEETPKIEIDSDWKAQAQAEKQKMAEQAEQSGQQGESAGSGGIPEASFETLISTLATQALFAMGAIPDPSSGQRMQHLDLAKHHIDTLGVIEDKTQGNLTDEEQELLATTVYELRQRYIQMATASRG